MLDGEFLTFEVSCTVGMSPSGMPHAHKAYQKKRYILKEGISHAPKACQKRRRRKYSPYQKENIQRKKKSYKGVPPSSTKNIHTLTHLDQGL